ncbi:hypothetical protein C0J52_02732 [Blattella germanica]|nr:hypothetical protein C0J52_02732 [Blattella germanica]
MGRHPLSPAAVPDPGPVFLSRLLFVVVVLAFHGVVALTLPVQHHPAPNSMDRLAEQEVAILKQRILEGLGLTRAPDVTKVRKSNRGRGVSTWIFQNFNPPLERNDRPYQS